MSPGCLGPPELCLTVPNFVLPSCPVVRFRCGTTEGGKSSGFDEVSDGGLGLEGGRVVRGFNGTVTLPTRGSLVDTLLSERLPPSLTSMVFSS